MANNQDMPLQDVPESDPETRHDDIDFQPRDDDVVDIDEPVHTSTKQHAAASGRFPAKTPIPASVKLGFALAAFVVIAIAAAGFFYVSSKSDLTDSENATLPAASPFEIGGAINIHDNNETESVQSAPPVIADDAAIEAAAVKESVDVDVDSLEARYSALLEDNARLHARIDEIIASTAVSDRTIDELRVEVASLADSRIPALLAADRTINVALDTLRSSADKIERRALEEARRNTESPPFIVTSIDEWGATASAVLNVNGRPTTASVGDVYSGWKITRIVWPDCIYAVRDGEASSHVVKVCGAGKS